MVAAAPDVPYDYRQRHPVTMTEVNHTPPVFVGTSRGELNATQRSDVAQFAHSWRREATGGVAIELPVGAQQRARGGGFRAHRSVRASRPPASRRMVSSCAGIRRADDYMIKSFHKDELVSRIHAVLRRSKGHAQSLVQSGDLVVNLDSKTAEVNSARVHLTGKEYQMLELLALRKDMTLTKEMFLNHLYSGMNEPELKLIDVFMCKLRKKLANASGGKNYVETMWGRGYLLRHPTEEEAVRVSA